MESDADGHLFESDRRPTCLARLRGSPGHQQRTDVCQPLHRTAARAELPTDLRCSATANRSNPGIASGSLTLAIRLRFGPNRGRPCMTTAPQRCLRRKRPVRFEPEIPRCFGAWDLITSWVVTACSATHTPAPDGGQILAEALLHTAIPRRFCNRYNSAVIMSGPHHFSRCVWGANSARAMN